MLKKTIIIIIFFICSILNLYANENIILSKSTKHISLGTTLEYLEDNEKKFTIDDILTKKISERFIKSTMDVPSFGFTNSAYWIKFTINSDLSVNSNWQLVLEYPLMDKISLYIPDSNNTYSVRSTGYKEPFLNREIKNKNFLFNLEIPAKKTMTYFMRFQNEDRMEIPLSIYSLTEFHEKDRTDQLIFGIYYGILIVMFLYNFFLFFYIRDKSYLYYIFFIFSYGLFQLTQNGLAYEYFVPRFLEEYNHYIPFTISIGIISILLFSLSFLDIKSNIPKLYKLFLALIGILIINIFLPLLVKYSTSIQISVFMSFIPIIVVFVSGIILLKRFRPAVYFMIAWSSFLVGILVYALRVLAVIPTNIFTTYAMQLGSVVQLILLSLGLGDRISVLRREKHLTSKQLFESQKRDLENQQKANKEIAEANKTILLSTQKYKLIVETSNDIIFSLDEKFHFISVNKAIKNTLRIAPDAVLKLNFLDLVYDGIEGIEAGASEFLAKQIVKEKLEQLLSTKERVSFTMDMISSHIIEPKEMVVTLEYLDIDGKAEILGRASSVIEDTLLKFFNSEKQMFSLGNYLVSADEVSHRATKNLRKYIDGKEISMLRVALREIIVNSIEHGNLDISFEEKSESLKAGTYLELVSRRQRDPRNTDKRVEIEYLINNEKAVYKISDEGKGFNYESIFSSDMDSLNEKQVLHGRGILMAKNIFDEITYNKKGNQVMLVKKFV